MSREGELGVEQIVLLVAQSVSRSFYLFLHSFVLSFVWRRLLYRSSTRFYLTTWTPSRYELSSFHRSLTCQGISWVSKSSHVIHFTGTMSKSRGKFRTNQSVLTSYKCANKVTFTDSNKAKYF